VSPDLASYDILLANISGGKDSQTMLRELVRQADEAGVRDRIVCVFADLGKKDEWEGTEEIARYHAEFYGLRFIVVRKGESKGQPVTLLEHIEKRGMWPDQKNRYCTSDMKRDPVSTIFTRLVREALEVGHQGVVRILNIQGMRAQESPMRAKMPAFRADTRASNGKRHVDIWLPIHGLTEAEVWADIKESGVRCHPIYDAGMPRLSCRFCVLAGRKSLVRAAQLDPSGAKERADLEDRMGHTFQNGTSMHTIIAEAEAATAAGIAVKASNWVG
jgi:3'-phosphoadenosine 5'-phosphosulfate sulfotransferase (PAPS reductase)/FAD synthetase